MLVLDFDGVIVDSLSEVIVNCYHAVSGQALALADLPPGFEASLRLNRFHCQPAGDLIVLAEWALCVGMHAPTRLLSAAEYQALLRSASDPLPQRRERFFRSRLELQQKLGKNWFALNAPYQPLWNAFLASKYQPIILTNKNGSAVLALFAHFGLKLAADRVFSGESGATKPENLRRIRTAFNNDQISFVDDSLSNLIELKSEPNLPNLPNLTLALASWGYLGPNDLSAAQNHGIEIWQQRQVLDQL